ncbi:hypothetical protein ACFL1H_01795 [Nanoarchaeota archaeon]
MQLEAMRLALEENLTGNIIFQENKGIKFLLHYAFLQVKGITKQYNYLIKGLILKPENTYGNQTTYQVSIESEPERKIPLFHTNEFEFESKYIETPSDIIESIKSDNFAPWGFNPHSKLILEPGEVDNLYDLYGSDFVKQLDDLQVIDFLKLNFLEKSHSIYLRLKNHESDNKYTITIPANYPDILYRS